MFDIFTNWLNATGFDIPDSLLFVFASISSLCVLEFIFDIFRFILYIVSGRR